VSFYKGDKVSTPLGLGTVAYVRMAPPDYSSAQAVSVVLDARRGKPGYTGTMFKASDVSWVRGGQPGDRRRSRYGSRSHGDVTLRTATLDGKHVGYSSETEFLVQIGKGRGGYRTKYRIVGNLRQAVMYYQGLNIGHGYKKRLLMPSSKKPVLAKASS